jgi:heat shock protein HslJ/uncharacterized membrane protein
MKTNIFKGILLAIIMVSCNRKIHQPLQTNTVSHNNSSKEFQPMTDGQYRNWQDKLLSGIDFIASGNEPFWSLAMNLDKNILFKMIGGDSIQAPAVKEIRLMDVTAGSYRVQTESFLLNVIVYDKPCVNSMSGDTLPKLVEVYVDDKKYSGCGRYLADYRLNDIWVLKSINDTAVNEKGLAKGLPRLEINLSTGKFYGTGGCNNINGNAEVKGKYIHFPRIISTRMACNDDGFESRYLAALKAKNMRYKVDNGLLTLQADDSVFTYRKID